MLMDEIGKANFYALLGGSNLDYYDINDISSTLGATVVLFIH